jgi:hypothetical protein
LHRQLLDIFERNKRDKSAGSKGRLAKGQFSAGRLLANLDFDQRNSRQTSGCDFFTLVRRRVSAKIKFGFVGWGYECVVQLVLGLLIRGGLS